jgi:amino acid adenylation domain-containing protein
MKPTVTQLTADIDDDRHNSAAMRPVVACIAVYMRAIAEGRRVEAVYEWSQIVRAVVRIWERSLDAVIDVELSGGPPPLTPPPPSRIQVRLGGNPCSCQFGATCEIARHLTATGLQLAVTLRLTPNGGEVVVHADARELDATTVSSFARTLVHALEWYESQPPESLSQHLAGRSISSIDLGSGGAPFAAAANWASQMIDLAQTRPDEVAICGAEAATFGDLIECASQTANALRRRGCGPGSCVVVHGSLTKWAVAAFLASSSVGAVYVPVDPDQPIARKRSIEEAVRPQVVIDLAVAPVSPWSAPTLVLRDIEEEVDVGTIKGFPTSSPAYVVFTSGTTGTPKGVEVGHAAFGNTCYGTNTAFGIEAGDVCLTLTKMGTDVAVWGMMAPLMVGAAIAIPTSEQRADPALLDEFLQDARVTVADLPPAILPLLNAAAIPRLRVLSVGGEPVSGASVASWQRDSLAVWNAYGPTEAAVQVSLKRCLGTSAPSLGRPMPGCHLLVVGDDGELLPRGAVGELAIGGACLADRYVADRERTAARFKTTRFGRLYLTGDIVRWRGDDDLVFLGREDRQVKISGNRIELDEIEAVLRRAPGVSGARVLTVELGSSTALIGFFSGKAESIADVLRYARQVLPEHAVPGRLIALDSLPVGRNGKTDDAALFRSVTRR